MQLTTLTAKDPITKSLRMASEVSLTINSTPMDPLGDIPVLGVVTSRFTVGDMVLDYGEVLYDYLGDHAAP
jgi:acetoacetate decarboxylase